MNRSTPGLPVHHHSQSSLRLTSIKSVMPSSHLILCHPLLLLPPIPPSIKVFSNESTLCMRWPKHWSFSFSIIPSKEISGLVTHCQLDVLVSLQAENIASPPVLQVLCLKTRNDCSSDLLGYYEDHLASQVELVVKNLQCRRLKRCNLDL